MLEAYRWQVEQPNEESLITRFIGLIISEGCPETRSANDVVEVHIIYGKKKKHLGLICSTLAL